MLKRLKAFLGKGRKAATVGTMALALMAFSATSAFAADTGTGTQKIVDDMKTAFGDLQTTALAALGAIGVIAIVLFAGIYAWRYGKQVFKVVAK